MVDNTSNSDRLARDAQRRMTAIGLILQQFLRPVPDQA